MREKVKRFEEAADHLDTPLGRRDVQWWRAHVQGIVVSNVGADRAASLRLRAEVRPVRHKDGCVLDAGLDGESLVEGTLVGRLEVFIVKVWPLP